jgi:hypothetical protein
VGPWFPGQKVRVLFSTRLIAQRVSVALEEMLRVLLRDPVDVLLGDVQLFKVGEQFYLPSELYVMYARCNNSLILDPDLTKRKAFVLDCSERQLGSRIGVRGI